VPLPLAALFLLASLLKTLFVPVIIAVAVLALLLLGAIAGAIAIGVLALFSKIGQVVFGRDLRPRWLRRDRGASA
jgi:hypothetical protein